MPALLTSSLKYGCHQTQASSVYLSTARLLRRSRQTCYIYNNNNNHTCSTTTMGERELVLLLPKKGKGWLAINLSTRLLPITAVPLPLQQTKEVEAWATSPGDEWRPEKVHSVESDLELMQCSRLRVRNHPKTEPETSKPARQLLTQQPPRNCKVIPLMLLFQRDGPCKGRLKKTSSGQEKKKKIK